MTDERRDRQVNVAGLLTIALLDAAEADAAAVERQLGLPAEPLDGMGPDAADDPAAHATDGPPAPPAITVRYVDALAARRGRLHRVGGSDVSWTDAGVIVAGGRGKSARGAMLRFEQLGGPVEIVGERGIGRLPLLLDILNLTMLGRGVLPLHASAFVYHGVGSAAAGWKESGKTDALLAVMGDGATMVSDEWTYVDQSGRAHGLPTPVRVEAGHLHAGLALAGTCAVARRRLRRLRALDLLGAVARPLARGRPGRPLRATMERLLRVDLPPRELFGSRSCAASMPLERVYWMVPYEPIDGGDRARGGAGRPGNRIAVEQVDGADVAARMALAHVYHRIAFLDVYWRHRYAFPDARSAIVEQMEERERELLLRALAGSAVFRVDHPARVQLGELRDALARPA